MVELIEKKEVGLPRGERRQRDRLSCREEEATSFAAANATVVAAVAAIFRRLRESLLELLDFSWVLGYYLCWAQNMVICFFFVFSLFLITKSSIFFQ